MTAAQLEAAVLDRTRRQRTFKRIIGPALEVVLPGTPVDQPVDEPHDTAPDETSATDGPDTPPTS